ncbi:MAG: transposase [Isosphaeraceae bacterium]
MSTPPLFPDLEGDGPAGRPPAGPGPAPPPRLRRPDREQMLMRPCSVDELIGDDHDARLVWRLVETWDLAAFLAAVRARGETPGRAATDPRLLVALWLYAATQGVAGGRELARLCESSDPYRWLCGTVPVNYHMLNDFRVGHEAAVSGLLTRMLAVLIHGGLVTVSRIAQDGTRVRAGAGANSFKRRDAIERALQQAEAHLEVIRKQAERAEDAAERHRAAEERAALRKVERMNQSLQELAKVEEAKAQQKAKPTRANPPRASTTDPDARFMRMPDGGTRPAYNVQLAVDAGSRAIVGVDVTNAGSDAGLAGPMRRSVEARTNEVVKEHLVDGGYVKLDELDRAAAAERPVTMTCRCQGPGRRGPTRTSRSGPTARGSRRGAAAWRRLRPRRFTGSRGDGRDGERGAEDRARADAVPGPRAAQGALRGAVEMRLAYNVMHFGWQLLSLAA